MRGHKVSVMIGNEWFESIKEAEVALGIYSLRERYNSALKKNKLPLYNGKLIRYNVAQPQNTYCHTKPEHIAGEPLIAKPVIYWRGLY